MTGSAHCTPELYGINYCMISMTVRNCKPLAAKNEKYKQIIPGRQRDEGGTDKGGKGGKRV